MVSYLVRRVAIDIRQAYADSTAGGDAESCGESIEDWYGEARAAIAAIDTEYSAVFDRVRQWNALTNGQPRYRDLDQILNPGGSDD